MLYAKPLSKQHRRYNNEWLESRYLPSHSRHTQLCGARVMTELDSIQTQAAVESWRPVVGFPGYEVSDLGRVRSYWRPNGVGPYVIGDTPKILKPARHKYGYERYVFGGRKDMYAHVMVLEAFVGPRPEGLVACHGPAGSACHALHNLSWGTQAKNCGEDRRRDGTEITGEKHVKAIFTEADILEIRRLRRAGMKQKEIANRYGTRQGHISLICLRKIWQCVPDEEGIAQ